MTGWEWCLLPVRPWTLPGIAARASTFSAFVVGSFTALVLGGFLLSASTVAGAEPFANLRVYLARIVVWTPVSCIFLIPLAALIWIYFIILGATSSSEHRAPPSRSTLPLAFLYVGSAIYCLRSPGAGIAPTRTVPGRTNSATMQ